MATQYTSLLGLALPVTGELQGTWGDTVNNSITSLLDTAVAGTTTLSTDGDVTLSTTTGASNQARQAVLLCTGARTALRTITAPAQSKTYTVINATTGGFSIKVVGVGPTTGVTIVAGESALIAWNGSDFIKISNTGGSASFTNVTVSGTTTLSGLTASTALALDASKNVVSVTNTGTGNNVLSASPTLTGTVAGASLQLSSLTSGRVTYATTSGLLTDSANMTFNGTRLTVADLADSGLTATRVVFSTTGGALTDSANLTFNGTDLTVSGAVNAGTINATTLDLTNLEVTNIKAKDGTAGMQIADSTGVVSFTANPVMSGGTANGVAYLNGSKVLTTGSALTFDGTNLGFGGNLNSTLTSEFYLQSPAGSNFIGINQASGYVRVAAGNAEVLRLSNTAAIFALSSLEQMRLTSTGLGIGTSSPAAKLQLGGYAGTVALRMSRASTDVLDFYQGAGVSYIDSSAAGGQLAFATVGTERMRLDAVGNLGIGTSSPGFRLDVAGTGNFQGIQTSGSPSLSFGASKWMTQQETGVARTYYCGPNASTYQSWEIYRATSTGGAALTASFDLNGNLGLGVTPSAWGSGTFAIDIGSGSALWNPGSGTQTQLLNNSFNNGTNFIYKNSSSAARYRMTGAQHEWYTAPSGTAGNAISFTQAMALTADGDFLVGSTSVPANGANARNVVFNNSNNNSTYVKLSNGISGATASDGFDLILGTSSDAYVYNRENGPMIFGTNNTERARIDSSGRVIVGSSSVFPNPSLINVVTSAGLACGFAVSDNTASYRARFWWNGGTDGLGIFNSDNGPIRFGTTDTERARIDASGNLLVGTTSQLASTSFASFSTGNGWVLGIRNTANSSGINITNGSGTASYSAIGFYNNGLSYSSCGTVTVSGTTTTYGTSSDYRMKENVQPMVGALARVAALKPVTYTWKSTGEEGEGFIAHELQEVCPSAVVGEKDAVDEDGKIKPQNIDTSFLVATLTAAIQEQQAIIEQLKADVAALKGA